MFKTLIANLLTQAVNNYLDTMKPDLVTLVAYKLLDDPAINSGYTSAIRNGIWEWFNREGSYNETLKNFSLKIESGVNASLKPQVRALVDELLNKEVVIDTIVDRIKRKQLP